MSLNYMGNVNVIKAVAPHMVSQGKGGAILIVVRGRHDALHLQSLIIAADL